MWRGAFGLNLWRWKAASPAPWLYRTEGPTDSPLQDGPWSAARRPTSCPSSSWLSQQPLLMLNLPPTHSGHTGRAKGSGAERVPAVQTQRPRARGCPFQHSKVPQRREGSATPPRAKNSLTTPSQQKPSQDGRPLAWLSLNQRPGGVEGDPASSLSPPSLEDLLSRGDLRLKVSSAKRAVPWLSHGSHRPAG